MEANVEQLILNSMNDIHSELRELRADNAEWREDYGQRMAKVETKVLDVVGNGQPGRLKKLEDSVASLIGYRFWLLGVAAAVGVVAALVGWCFPRH